MTTPDLPFHSSTPGRTCTATLVNGDCEYSATHPVPAIALWLAAAKLPNPVREEAVEAKSEPKARRTRAKKGAAD